MDDDWLVRAFSDHGEELAGLVACGWSSASSEHLDAVEHMERHVADQIGRGPVPLEWSRALEGGFEHPIWDRVAERCLSCSVCSYVCPSCSCFDMNHDANAWRGGQWRSWDACTFALFTRHASGHNPRATRAQRYRQRVLHKFAFASDDQRAFRCVGCGRCLALCPAGLDILESVEVAVSAILGEDADDGD
jgi:ferredoxin